MPGGVEGHKSQRGSKPFPSRHPAGRSKTMTYINVYDIEAKQIDSLCDEYGTTEPELIEAILSAVEEGEINISEWL